MLWVFVNLGHKYEFLMQAFSISASLDNGKQLPKIALTNCQYASKRCVTIARGLIGPSLRLRNPGISKGTVEPFNSWQANMFC